MSSLIIIGVFNTLEYTVNIHICCSTTNIMGIFSDIDSPTVSATRRHLQAAIVMIGQVIDIIKFWNNYRCLAISNKLS